MPTSLDAANTAVANAIAAFDASQAAKAANDDALTAATQNKDQSDAAYLQNRTDLISAIAALADAANNTPAQ